MVDRRLVAGARQVRVFSRDEATQEAMRRRVRDERVRHYVGDVRDPDTVMKATRGVEYVFHAAALKQVPSCEFFPLEAVRTDKAVYPVRLVEHAFVHARPGDVFVRKAGAWGPPRRLHVGERTLSGRPRDHVAAAHHSVMGTGGAGEPGRIGGCDPAAVEAPIMRIHTNPNAGAGGWVTARRRDWRVAR